MFYSPFQTVPSPEEIRNQILSEFDCFKSIVTSPNGGYIELDENVCGIHIDFKATVCRFDSTKCDIGGAAYLNNGQYFIFLSDSPCISFGQRFYFVSDIEGRWLEKYLILHECGHIIEKHVFDDDPQGNYEFYKSLITSYNNDQELLNLQLKEDREIQADKWGTYFLKQEAEKAGDQDLVKRIDQEIQQRGIPLLEG